MKLSIRFVIFSVCVFLVAALFAETPTSLEQMPLYKGMKLVSEDKFPEGEGLRFGIRRTYEVNAPTEDVVQFYEKQLGITKRFEDATDQNDLKVGESVKPTIQVYHYDDSLFIDGDFGEGGSSRRAWIKKELLKRNKDKENAWIEGANSEWYFRDTKSSMTTLHVMIDDKSIDEEANTYDLKTEVIIEVMNYDYEL